MGLIASAKGIGPSFAGEDTVVTMISGNVNTALAGFSFELAFTGERVGAAERDLVIDFDESRSRIKENGPSNVLRRRCLAPISIGEATANRRFILIHIYAIARMELFF